MSAESTVRIMCPNLTCRKVLVVPASARGKTVRCKGCSTNIRVPTHAPPPPPPPEPAGATGAAAAAKTKP